MFIREPFQAELRQNDIALDRQTSQLNLSQSLAEASLNRAISDRERLNAQNDARAQSMAARLGITMDTNAQSGMMQIHQDGQRAIEDLMVQRAANSRYYSDQKNIILW